MRIFKSNLSKKILGLLIILGCSGIFLNGYVGIGESVYAENSNAITEANTTNDTQSTGGLDTMSLWQILNLLLKIIYIFLWPLLVIAGLSLDNTLVYASIFNMDAPLWKFWNMMKNFANFALGFMVLFAIIKSIITNSGEGSLKDEKSPLGIIKKTLIAGILIQASWFLMAVLVDISTIATYAVGGLPLNVLKNDDIGKMQIITVNSSINLDKFDIISAGGEGFDVWYTLEYQKNKMKVSPCRIEEGFVIGRVKGGIDYKNSEKFNGIPAYEGNELCVLYGNKIVMWEEDTLMGKMVEQNDPNGGPYPSWYDEVGYNGILKKTLQNTGWTDLEFIQQYAVKLGGSATGSNAGLAMGEKFLDDEDTVTMQLSQLIDKSKGFVGPLVTIYSSLLNFAQLTDTDITSVGETSGVFIIKTGVALALFFPLLALAIVLIARIGLLWLFIVASPFIILKESFSDFLKLGKLDEYLSIKSVIGIVFAPVISVAALSLSLIFLTALLNGFSSNDPNDSTRFEQAFSAEKIEPINTENDAINFQGAASIEFTKLPRGDALDRFSWLLVNFFAIGLMWMIVFAAIKANKLGEKIGGNVQKFGGNMFKTLPIIPMPNGQNVGVGSMAKVLSEAPDRKIQAMETRDNDIVSDWFDGKDSKITKLDETQAGKIFFNGAGITKKGDVVQKIQEVTGAKQEDVAGIISDSVTTIGAAVSGIKDDAERNQVIEAIANAGGLEKVRYDNYVKDEKISKTKPEVDKIAKKAKNLQELQTEFSKPENKTAIEAYFTASEGEDYKTTIGKTNYIVKQNKQDPTNITYTVEEETTTSK